MLLPPKLPVSRKALVLHNDEVSQSYGWLGRVAGNFAIFMGLDGFCELGIYPLSKGILNSTTLRGEVHTSSSALMPSVE
jgi:hypothetical protein